MPQIPLSKLISHRFRGFSQYENTIDGMVSAMDAGAIYLECDVRVTHDGVPVIYHDQDVTGASGRRLHIHTSRLRDLNLEDGAAGEIPKLEALLTAFAQHPNKRSKLMLDLKVGGFEQMILAAVHMTGCAGRVIYVSWVADALYNMHALDNSAPLIFSHWAKYRSEDGLHDIYRSSDGVIPRGTMKDLHGGRHAWCVESPLKGDMLRILRKTGGGICVPKSDMTVELARYYKSKTIKISTFAYTDMAEMAGDIKSYDLDLAFADSKAFFEP